MMRAATHSLLSQPSWSVACSIDFSTGQNRKGCVRTSTSLSQTGHTLQGGHSMNRFSKGPLITVVLLAAAGAWIIGPALAQPAPTPSAPGLSPPHQSSSVAEGTVVQYLMNHYGEVDGLLLSNGTQVQFPAHMEKNLIAVVKPSRSEEHTPELQSHSFI